MLNPKETLILVGKSPILDDPEVNSALRKALLKYTSIGINQASYLFKTNYFAFVDSDLKHYYNVIHPNTKIITIPLNVTSQFDCECCEIFTPKKDEDCLIKEGRLAYCGFTHDMCLSWAYSKGFKNVILFGVADFTKDNYSARCNNLFHCKQEFTPADVAISSSANYINTVFSKYLNIYTVNPNSLLSIPRISLEDI